MFLPASYGAQTTASGGAPTVPLAGVRELPPESAPLSSGPVEVPFAPKGCSSSPHLGLPMRVGIERNRRGRAAALFAGEAQGQNPVVYFALSRVLGGGDLFFFF